MLYYSELFTFCTICSSFIFPWLERRRTSWSCLAKNATKKWKLQHINHLATFTISLSHTHAHPHAFFKHTHTLLSSFPWSLLAASLLLLSTHLCQACRALHQIFFQHTHTRTRTHTHALNSRHSPIPNLRGCLHFFPLLDFFHWVVVHQIRKLRLVIQAAAAAAEKEEDEDQFFCKGRKFEKLF